VGIVVVVLVGCLFIVLLASGVLSRRAHANAAQPATTAPALPVSRSSEPGTSASAAQLNEPFGPDAWGSYGGSYDEIRHSQLTEITKGNVHQLGVAFRIDFKQLDKSVPLGEQSFPIVVGGTIYVTTGNDHVFAIDGATGKPLWEYTPSDTAIFANYGVNANRGVAYCDGNVYLLTLDMRIVAIDASNGKLVREVPISDAVPGATVQNGYSETAAPICYDGILIAGASGSDYSARGFVMAWKAVDLSPAWSSPYWIIPPDGREWRSAGPFVGGGTNWNPATIDTQTNTLYITSSNPSPIFDPSVRPGPDARTDSLIALDVSTGEQRWWRQQLAGDQWGYSTAQPALLFNVKVGSGVRRVVSVGTKEGVWFMYDARTGAPIYEHVRFVARLEHPVLRPGGLVTVYPSAIGGLNYSPSSYDPATGHVINSQAETGAVLAQVRDPAEINARKQEGDVNNGLVGNGFGIHPAGWHDYGSITAIDAAQGTLAWTRQVPEPGRGGVTTTDSGLAFVGGGDGNLLALDTSTGNTLWSFQTGHQIAAAPAIYEAGGHELIAITVGGTPTTSYGGTAAQLEVFSLKGSQTQYPAPAIAPPNVHLDAANPPPYYLSLAPQVHTLRLLVVASQGSAAGANTLDGTSHGRMAVAVPRGWRVNVSFSNQAARRSDAVAVVASPGAREPVFSGASAKAAASGTAYFHFTAARQGEYVLGSTVDGRAAAGEWLKLDVVGSTELPGLDVPGHPPYKVVVGVTASSTGGPGNGNG
jgi:PQQ-dependent dehydrogenase (methanol/ethanol family)